MMKNNRFIKVSLLCGGILLQLLAKSQELYVFTEPASNMPSKSVSAKLTAKFTEDQHGERNYMQRYTPEVMLGLNKRWMLHGAVSFSDMFTARLRWESARVYAKYRFLSSDEVHKHFRMAVFGEYSYSRNTQNFEELNFEGDKSGLQTGLVATQLWNRLAVSATGTYLLYAGPRYKVFPQAYPYQAFNYTASAGFLVLPLKYSSFRQTNLNIYAELLGQQALDMDRYYVDFAPAIQLIFNSNSKLNLGYRYELSGQMTRMGRKGFLLSFETTFLNALK